MGSFWAFILGMVQGITEFLPISSTAHLIIIPYLFRIPDLGLSFDVALHLGTILAILIYFFRDWLDMILAIFKGGEKRRLFLYLIIATIPAGIFGIILDPITEKIAQPQSYPFAIPIICIGLISFGIIFLLFERGTEKSLKITDLNIVKALTIGFWQVFALFPGVSRSGSTISGGLFVGLRREESARFSFLLSLPTLLGALLLKSYQVYKGHVSLDLSMTFLGIISAFIFGILSIKFLLSYLKRNSLRIFAYYRFILAIFLLIIYFLR